MNEEIKAVEETIKSLVNTQHAMLLDLLTGITNVAVDMGCQDKLNDLIDNAGPSNGDSNGGNLRDAIAWDNELIRKCHTRLALIEEILGL